MQQIKLDEWKRQEDTVLVISKNGVIKSDCILKEGESVNITNKSQTEGYKKKLEKDSKVIELSEYFNLTDGDYFHLIYKYYFPLMEKLQSKKEGNTSNIHIVRFIKLATHVTFGGRLFDDNRNEIKKSSLAKIWDVKNRSSINETYNLLKECGYITETEEGYLMISKDLVTKGAMDCLKKAKKQDKYLTYTRVFSKNIQHIYNNTKPAKRKHLATLFKALPYINYKYNIFCSNPTETDRDKLQLLTWTELARLCGYEDDKNIKKFKKDLWDLDFYGHALIGQFSTKYGYCITVNPKVYYGGNDIEDLKYLNEIFTVVK